MKSGLIKQHQIIKLNINKNAEIIKDLIQQAVELNQIIESLGDTNSDEVKKKDLEDQVTKLNNTINDLISQTADLFLTYDKFARNVFGVED